MLIILKTCFNCAQCCNVSQGVKREAEHPGQGGLSPVCSRLHCHGDSLAQGVGSTRRRGAGGQSQRTR